MLKVETFAIDGLKLISPMAFEDERGYFFESYNAQAYSELGIADTFVQDNQSYSPYGTLRGLHMQTGDFSQSKLVRVSLGEVLDVAVDLRKGSRTYGQYATVILSAQNKQCFYIPRGFAHGFLVLSKEAIFQYKCDNYYDKNSEAGIKYDDPDLNIDWGLSDRKFTLSEKDLSLSSLREFGG
ncbi:MAG: dTDP-4-dehydrorhamnose 3,5-epimerase [Bdellovibrionaceae bacterium]|jgi:dTDP-4-dehydrorhamnose 3,5-epimerase|nr:dTDP-4-dehydrorhamnose 3,5-epimerase [Pseudobdellovibrionaceae bacterium]